MTVDRRGAPEQSPQHAESGHAESGHAAPGQGAPEQDGHTQPQHPTPGQSAPEQDGHAQPQHPAPGQSAPEQVTNARLGLVTVSYHSAQALAELLTSLEKSTVLPASVIVVDNASECETLHTTVSTRLPGFEIVNAGSNLGYGGAVNLGARYLREKLPELEWIVIANPDAVIEADTLSILLSVGASRPDAAALGPLIHDPDGQVYPSARELPSLGTGIGHALLANLWQGNPWTRRYHGENRRSSDSWRETGWLSGSFLLVRDDAFRAVGGFDDAFFMYFEDVDLGRRFGESGWHNLYVPGAHISHEGAHSTKHSSESAALMRRTHHKSAYRYLAARYPAWWQWPLRAGLKLALTLRAHVTSLG